MSKRAKVGNLARILHCSPRQARDFAANVNRKISAYGISPVSYDRIYHALQMTGGHNQSEDEVARRFVGRRYSGESERHLPDDSNIPDSTAHQGKLLDPITNGRVRESSTNPSIEAVAQEEVSDETPANALQIALTSLLTLFPKQVTYTQIESVLSDGGIDPFQAEEEYLWLIEQLETNGIAVVDQLASPIAAEPDLTEQAILETAEVRQVLDEIFGAISEDDDRLLTADEQRRLLETFQIGEKARLEIESGNAEKEMLDALQAQFSMGRQALQLLMVRNRRLVASLALKHGKGARHLEFEDLLQEGMLGLWRAIERFDLDSSSRLSTYATWWIRQAISRAIADQERTIRLPVHRVETLHRLHVATSELTKKLQRTPRPLELAIYLNLVSERTVSDSGIDIENNENLSDDLPYEIRSAVEQVQKLQIIAALQPASLDAPVGNTDEAVLAEVLTIPEDDSVEQIVERRILHDQIERILEPLKPRERYVLVARFGLDGGPPQTLDEIGKKWGVTRERIRQIEVKVIDRLRRTVIARGLHEFLEIDLDEHSSDSMPPTQPDAESSA